MELENKISLDSDTIFDLKMFFKRINIPEYIEKSDSYYNDSGHNIAELKRLLYKTKLEAFTEYLVFAGYEFKAYQDAMLEGTLVRIQKEVIEAKVLQKMRYFALSKLSLSINSPHQEKLRIYDNEILQIVKDSLEKKFEKSSIDGGTRISDDELKNYIARETEYAFRTGAPSIMHRTAKFAELLIFLMYYKENFNYTPETIEKFSNDDCRLVHDFLVFWGLIENKRQWGTAHSYIRTMISNLRKQRNSGKIK